MVLKATILQKGASWFNLPNLTVLLMFLSFQIYGLGTTAVGGFHIAPWDWASLLIAMLWLIYPRRSRVQIHRALILGLRLSFLFVVWMGVAAIFSPQPERALTLILMQFRNLLVMLCIGTLFSRVRDLSSLNRAIFWTGVVLSAIAIVMFIFALFQYQHIKSNPSLWKPSIGYILDKGGVLRLTGFAKDPNFYSLWMALAFFSGLSLPHSLAKWTGVSIIGLSLVLAMSRGFAFAFVIATGLIVGVALLQARIMRDIWRRYIGPIVAIGIFLTLVFGGLSWCMGGLLWEFVTRRIALVASTPRFIMWKTLLHTDYNPIVGLGLRGTEEVLGMYSHNSYLDVIFEMGVVGFLLWVLIIGYVSLTYLSRLRHLEWIPWIHTWLTMLVMFASVSLVYHPFSWVMVAVALGASKDYTLSTKRLGELFGKD